METAMSRYVRVVQAHKDSCPDPISGKEGDVFLLGGRHSADYPDFVWAIGADDRCDWIPKAFLQQDGDFGRLVRDYTAREVTVAVGEVVEIFEEIGGWLWIATHDGREGWIPAKSVAYLRDRARLASTR
jgi:hypothetical protein